MTVISLDQLEKQQNTIISLDVLENGQLQQKTIDTPQAQNRFILKKENPYKNYSYGDALIDSGKTLANNFADVGDTTRNIARNVVQHPFQSIGNALGGALTDVGNFIAHPVDTTKSGIRNFSNTIKNAPNRPVDAALSLAGTGMLAEGGGSIIKGVSNTIKPSPRIIGDKIFKEYNYITGTKIKNIRDVGNIKDKTLLGVKTMEENIPNTKFVNPQSGEAEVRPPQNRLEDLQLLQQSKKSVWDKVSSLSGGATAQNSMIDYSSIVDKALQKTKKELGTVALNTGENGKTLNDILDNLAAGEKRVNTITPTEAQDYLRVLNDKTRVLRNSANPIDYSSKDLYPNIVNELNDATDKAITDALGQGGYKAERAKYSALLSLEKQKISAANRFISQQSGKLGGVTHPISNLFSLESILEGGLDVFTGNAAKAGGKFIRAGSIKTAQMISDIFKNPDRRIANMYKLAGKLRGN